MTRYQAGDDIVVEFDGAEFPGEVLRHSPRSGYVMAVITVTDPELDFGSIGARFDPQPTVCVPEARVRRREQDSPTVE